MTARDIFQSSVWIAIGLWVIRIGRDAYQNPHRMRDRWFSHLPQKDWSYTLVKVLGVVWVFLALILICAGVLTFFFWARGIPFLVAMVAIAAVATPFVLPGPSRIREEANRYLLSAASFPLRQESLTYAKT